jgi:transposase
VDVIIDRCAGLDVHKASVTGCVRVPGSGRRRRDQEVRSFSTMHHGLVDLAAWLTSRGVTDVAMEATGMFWRPVWYVLEDAGFDLLLVNPRYAKNVPGRKTDVKDSEWIAQLLECGLLRASFVPPRPIRQLRDLTRYRNRVVQERARESQRIEKVLEDAGIKLDVVISDCLGVSGRSMLEALIAGVRDPQALAELARGKMRPKVPVLTQALHGRFDDHHAAWCREIITRLDDFDATIDRLDSRIDELMAPYADQRDRLVTIPGVAKRAAEVIIAEIGVDMTRFPTSAHLASWAGMCPGNRESAGKQRSGRTRQANPWLRGMLTQCGWAARRTKDTYLAAQFWQIAARRGKEKASLAVGHSILVSAWHLLNTPDATYQDLGGDWFTRRKNPQAEQRRLLRRLEALGLKVTVETNAA